MRLGILLNGKKQDDITRRLTQAREAGFSLCQINLLHTGVTRAEMVAIAEAIEEQGVRPVAIGCYLNPLRPDEPSPLGPCRADLDIILHALDIVGARRVVISSGTYADTLHEAHPDNGSDASVDALREFLREVVRTTRARHYTLVIEPWRVHVLNTELKIREFHETLEPQVAEHVRYVLDATGMLTPGRFMARDDEVCEICRTLGPLAGLVHLQDCDMPEDGDAAILPPGAGAIDYAAYVAEIMNHAAPGTPAIARNVKSTEFASIRDYLLRLSDGWQLT